jgi:hypothetical protein
MHVLCSRGAADRGASPQSDGGALAATSARAHPHIPRRRKSTRPLRASSGNASPSAAMRSVSYLDAMTDACGAMGAAAPVSLGSFFFQDGALDCARMDLEAEFALD